MVGDFSDYDEEDRPPFFFHLGDVIYSFGEESSQRGFGLMELTYMKISCVLSRASKRSYYRFVLCDWPARHDSQPN
jgi:hypothetical protein